MNDAEKLSAIASLLAEGELLIGWDVRDIESPCFPCPGDAAEVISPHQSSGEGLRIYHRDAVGQFRDAIARGRQLRNLLEGVAPQTAL